jgi:hypothetical protein
MISRAQATVRYGAGRSILSDHFQYKRQHMTMSKMKNLANRHKQIEYWLTKVTLPKFRTLQG